MATTFSARKFTTASAHLKRTRFRAKGAGGGSGPVDSPLKVKDGPDWKPAGLRVP